MEMPKYKVPIVGSGTAEDPQRPAQLFTKDDKVVEFGRGYVVVETKKPVEKLEEGVEELK